MRHAAAFVSARNPKPSILRDIGTLIAAHPLDEAASRVKYGTTMWLYEFV